MAYRLRETTIADLNRGVYNSILMHYKVNGEPASLEGATIVLTCKDVPFDDSDDIETSKFIVTGQIDTEDPSKVLFPITAEQSQLDPTKQYWADIVLTRPGGVPLRKAILTFGVMAGASNANALNNSVDGSAGSAVCVNDCGCQVIVINNMTGERGPQGLPGTMTSISLNDQVNIYGGSVVPIPDSINLENQGFFLTYGGQVISPDKFILSIADRTLSFNPPVDTLEGRELRLYIGNAAVSSPTSGNGGGLTTEQVNNLISTAIANVPTLQPAYVADYAGSNTFTLPKTPVALGDIWVLQNGVQLTLLQSSDYTVSGATITINSPVLSNGMRVRINYTAKESRHGV